MRLKAIVTILGCVLTAVTAARPAGATPILTTNPASFVGLGITSIDFEDIVVPPGGTVPITNQYVSKGVVFSAGLHTDTAFPALAPAILGAVAVTNGDPGCCPSITMSFSSPLKSFGADFVSLDPAVTQLDIFATLGGVPTFTGSVVLDTALEIKFFGILANPADANPLFDSIVITTLLAPGVTSGFIMDNVRFEAVPEPASLTLLGSGAMALLARRRARRNAATRSA